MDHVLLSITTRLNNKLTHKVSIDGLLDQLTELLTLSNKQRSELDKRMDKQNKWLKWNLLTGHPDVRVSWCVGNLSIWFVAPYRYLLYSTCRTVSGWFGLLIWYSVGETFLFKTLTHFSRIEFYICLLYLSKHTLGLKQRVWLVYFNWLHFTFIHLADAFIQSGL